VKSFITPIVLAVLLVGLVLLGSNDTDISVADTSVSPTDTGIPNNEITTNQTQTSNSSASAAITITMYTGDE